MTNANDWRGVTIIPGQTVIVSPKSDYSTSTECIVEEIREKNIKCRIIRRQGGVTYSDKQYTYVKSSSITVVDSLPASSLPEFEEMAVANAKERILHYQTTTSCLNPEYIREAIENCQKVIDKYTL